MKKYISGHSSGANHSFERSAGKVLVLKRWAEGYEGDTFKYEVLAEIPTEQFFKGLDRQHLGPITPDDMSDYLVNAFDRGLAYELKVTDASDGCLYAYVGADESLVIHQHST